MHACHAAGPGSIPGRVNFLVEVFPEFFLNFKTNVGAKVDWDFRISDLVKNPDETDV